MLLQGTDDITVLEPTVERSCNALSMDSLVDATMALTVKREAKSVAAEMLGGS